MSEEENRRILYLIVCAAGPAVDVGKLVDLAREGGWTVQVIATPSALDFIDVAALEVQTGRPVRSRYRKPGEPHSPRADAIIVAPATFNTINKWAAGVSDTYALGVLAEALGLSIPVVVLPFVNTALASRAPYRKSIEILLAEGALILQEESGNAPHPPGSGSAASFPGSGLFYRSRSSSNAQGSLGGQRRGRPLPSVKACLATHVSRTPDRPSPRGMGTLPRSTSALASCCWIRGRLVHRRGALPLQSSSVSVSPMAEANDWMNSRSCSFVSVAASSSRAAIRRCLSVSVSRPSRWAAFSICSSAVSSSRTSSSQVSKNQVYPTTTLRSCVSSSGDSSIAASCRT
ncbi:flavoprotein [Actinomadura sp. PM05-2]|uniref:Flavoprotein n=1 Tax=Actinomadura parmotrematis TaxID=2864039 RepID=A0ABS7FNT1_9ACTN|nr:flavoprotein [Actinomadura parmotrematis]